VYESFPASVQQMLTTVSQEPFLMGEKDVWQSACFLLFALLDLLVGFEIEGVVHLCVNHIIPSFKMNLRAHFHILQGFQGGKLVLESTILCFGFVFYNDIHYACFSLVLNS
jgi:hypothetical protein